MIAITAGQLASMSATKAGPTGPFSLSVLFLAIGSLLTSILWNENTAKKVSVNGTSSCSCTPYPSTHNHPQPGNETKKPGISDAFSVMMSDKRIMLVGAIQALFEGAMYIFVLQVR